MVQETVTVNVDKVEELASKATGDVAEELRSLVPGGDPFVVYVNPDGTQGGWNKANHTATRYGVYGGVLVTVENKPQVVKSIDSDKVRHQVAKVVAEEVGIGRMRGIDRPEGHTDSGIPWTSDPEATVLEGDLVVATGGQIDWHDYNRDAKEHLESGAAMFNQALIRAPVTYSNGPKNLGNVISPSRPRKDLVLLMTSPERDQDIWQVEQTENSGQI